MFPRFILAAIIVFISVCFSFISIVQTT